MQGILIEVVRWTIFLSYITVMAAGIIFLLKAAIKEVSEIIRETRMLARERKK